MRSQTPKARLLTDGPWRHCRPPGPLTPPLPQWLQAPSVSSAACGPSSHARRREANSAGVTCACLSLKPKNPLRRERTKLTCDSSVCVCVCVWCIGSLVQHFTDDSLTIYNPQTKKDKQYNYDAVLDPNTDQVGAFKETKPVVEQVQRPPPHHSPSSCHA